MPNHTKTWGHQTAVFFWKKSGKCPTTKETWPKKRCIPQMPSCDMLSGQKTYSRCGRTSSMWPRSSCGEKKLLRRSFIFAFAAASSLVTRSWLQVSRPCSERGPFALRGWAKCGGKAWSDSKRHAFFRLLGHKSLLDVRSHFCRFFSGFGQCEAFLYEH